MVDNQNAGVSVKVPCLKVPLHRVQRVKSFLIENELIDFNYKMRVVGDFGYLPVVRDKINEPRIKSALFSIMGSHFEIIEYSLFRNDKKRNLKELLRGKLSDKELELLKTSFDVVGDIAIMEIDDALRDKEGIIAEAVLRLNGNIKTVVKKSGVHSGVFRIQKHVFLAGERKFVTFHRENGVVLKVDINEMYFSPRLATERMRIAKQVKDGERVLVMFSGCAPYPCVISKNSNAESIVGVELNPKAHEFGLYNVNRNKISNVDLILGDVRNVVPHLNQKFDRILMPLPMNSGDFLDTALTVAKKGTIIHVYDFVNESEFDNTIKKTISQAKGVGVSIRVKELVKCGQFAPRVFRVCLDCVVI
ncbi:MAG: class I SAM-dependent methyltransferase family protein [Nitrospiraceae bacterium]|nr:class I SAM-dependent methyltransferase family protein [Nitrospiraceae bacterium]